MTLTIQGRQWPFITMICNGCRRSGVFSKALLCWGPCQNDTSIFDQPVKNAMALTSVTFPGS